MGNLRSRFRGAAVAVAAAALLAGCADGADGGNDASAGDGGTAAENTAQPAGANGGDGGSGDGGAEDRPSDVRDSRIGRLRRTRPARRAARGAIPSDPSPVQTVKQSGRRVLTLGNCGIDRAAVRDRHNGPGDTGGPIDAWHHRQQCFHVRGATSAVGTGPAPATPCPWSRRLRRGGVHGDFVCLSGRRD